MKAEKHPFVWNVLLIIFICLNLANINAGRFEGDPPPETEVVEVTETPEEEEPSVESTPPAPAVTEETPTEEPVATEEPSPTAEPPVVEPVATEPPPTEEPAATEEPPAEEAIAEEEVAPDEEPVVELLSDVPENTDIVVLDENGEAVPLVAQEAADIILEEDPMWCPAGVLPGGPGCSINFPNISSLINNMRSNTNAYDEDGIIYFTSGNTNASLRLTRSSLGTSDFNTLNDYNLTLQGGWNGANGGGATFTGMTNFGSYALTIGESSSSRRWQGNIVISNFSFSNVSSNNAITVYTTGGDIELNNIIVSQQGGEDYTANLDSYSGDITVENSSFDGNDSGSNENRGFRAKTNSGSITITDTSFSDAHGCARFLWWCIDSWQNFDGATLSAPTVTLTNVTANNNDLSGIQISNANTVYLNNVTATNNGTASFFSGSGSGINVNGTGSTIVHVNGGMLSNNEAYGLSVFNGSISVQLDPTCNGNRYPGPDPSRCYNILPLDTTPPVLNLPANITVEATGPAGAIVSYSASAVDDRDGTVPVSCSPSSGNTFPLGTTTVNCSATDGAGNTANGNFNVTVQDTTPPTLTLPSNITEEATGPSGAVATFSVSAVDIVSGALPVTCSEVSGSTFPIGITTVNCSATDGAGNIASGSFTITVQDKTPPVIAPHEDILLETWKVQTQVRYNPPTTFDIVDGSGVATCSPASGSMIPIGVTVVTCTATDSFGNVAIPVTFTITVEKVDKPATSATTTILPVTGGSMFDVSCIDPARNTLLPPGAKITFINLCGYQAVVEEVLTEMLPETLPGGASFVNGVTINVFQDDDQVQPLPDDASILLGLPTPVDTEGKYAILYWDGSKWTELNGQSNDEGFVDVASEQTGIFILVAK